MLEKRYKTIVYFIAFTIVATIGVQVYWNLKVYEVNKQQVMNQVQVSFDKAVDDYYSELAKVRILGYSENDTIQNSEWKVHLGVPLNSDMVNNDIIKIKKNLDSSQIDKLTDPSFYKVELQINGNSDTIPLPKEVNTLELQSKNNANIDHISVFRENIDSVSIQNLTSKIIYSFREKYINLEKTDSLFKIDLEKKNIDLHYGFRFENISLFINDTISEDYKLDDFSNEFTTVTANSTFLPYNSTFQLLYTDMTFVILKRMLGSIFLSLLLSVVIVGCLLFLLNVIFKQKQLSEIKNDLISNITHEFKTPISTISVALEGLQNFDAIKDPTKTKNYLKLSSEQLGKLNEMVEKLLETATLNKDQFNLDKEPVNISDLLKTTVDKHQFSNPNKQLTFNSESTDLLMDIDLFHFRNAINNILDNAVKYGGDTIEISLTKNNEILIQDNGNGIQKNQQEKIFEQFYRIPTGNIHNVKGFGIGLYYTRNIIEKHGGTISIVESYKGKTVFKIVLNHE